MRTYVFQPNGSVLFVEEAKWCNMCMAPDVLLAFADGKIERVSVEHQQLRVEHWDPASKYPDGAPLHGLGQRLKARPHDPVAVRVLAP